MVHHLQSGMRVRLIASTPGLTRSREKECLAPPSVGSAAGRDHLEPRVVEARSTRAPERREWVEGNHTDPDTDSSRRRHWRRPAYRRRCMRQLPRTKRPLEQIDGGEAD